MAAFDDAAVLNEVFAFLPLPVLLTSGALTASRQLNACVLASLAQRPSISCSELCAASRKRLTESALQHILRGVRIGPDASSTGLLAQSLNLNRCPGLDSTTVIQLLRSASLPNLRRLSFGGARRAFTSAALQSLAPLPPHQLESLDLSSCHHLDGGAIQLILEMVCSNSGGGD